MKTRSFDYADSAQCSTHPDPLWDEDDLIDRLATALDFAARAIGHLAAEGYTDELDRDANLRPEKLISETGVLLLAASAVESYSAIGPRIHRVAALLEPHAHSQRMLRGICLEPAVAFEYATAHICLKRLGYYDGEFDAMLDLAAAAQSSAGRERPPHRMMEQEWLKQSWLYPEGLSRLRASASLAHSALNQPIDLLHGTRDDVYGFTHAMMYLRDFNLFPRRLPRCRETILAEAEAMLARALDHQDYDLAGEVLLAWPLSGDEWSPAAAFGFRVLASVERAAGFLPAPSTRVERLGALRPDEARPYFLATAYHTVYVMGLLAAAALAPGRRPPSRVPAAETRTGTLAAVLGCFGEDHETCAPHWKREFALLGREEQEPLAGLLLSIALHRAVGRKDFAAMQNLLMLAHNLNLVDNPLASQAAEMMIRVAQFANQFHGGAVPSHEAVLCGQGVSSGVAVGVR